MSTKDGRVTKPESARAARSERPRRGAVVLVTGAAAFLPFAITLGHFNGLSLAGVILASAGVGYAVWSA